MTNDPPTYVENLLNQLDGIAKSYGEVVAASGIDYVNPNRHDTDIMFLGWADWGWSPSDNNLESSRMALLRRLRDWVPCFRLLFPHPTPEVANRLDEGIGHLERWLVRDGRSDHDIPSTIEEAQHKLAVTLADLRGLTKLLPSDDYSVRLVVDTNALLDNPDLAAYVGTLGRKYVVHLLPVVLGEIDDLKRGGRNEIVRDAAKRADRRLKGIRTNGDVGKGVRVAGDVIVKFEHIEPRSQDLPAWLDMTVPDDRFVASTLLLQSEHPGSALYAGTSDINLQTKLAATGLPHVEPPPEIQ
ncbi:hypothetical protein MycrhDRAFT_1152 [Mycolicibacterium rhodesiae JS60]|nr:hypothetical protein MycrhDRAFT_1152 [Mycolicibacterium rhodesiae JS60]